ncbi:MAG: TrmB family transcriptional regulator [Chloroflexi bacterium]|nr:MAG: TrmB family transcriptional regulator [Chloroflexota bacterium]
MQKTVEQLMLLGFSQYEAQAYITLLEHNPTSGYELAKASGIPRANIYRILDKLEERGAVLRDESPEGTRYVPTHPSELVSRLRNGYQTSLEVVEESLCRISKSTEPDTVWNLQGYKALIKHALSTIDSAQEKIQIAIWPSEAIKIEHSIEQAEKRGVEVTTLCLAGCKQPCGSCRGTVQMTPTAAQDDGNWLIIIRDAEEVLAGEVRGNGDAQSLRTRQKMVVRLVTRGLKFHSYQETQQA